MEGDLNKATLYIEENKHKVDFANDIHDTKDTISMEEFAKALCGDNMNIGRTRLFRWMYEHNYLQKNKKPYQEFIDRGYFTYKERTYTKIRCLFKRGDLIWAEYSRLLIMTAEMLVGETW